VIEVRRSPEGKILARRSDGQPLTAEDREEAKLMAAKGITATDVLRVFGGGRVIGEHKLPICRYCNKQESIPAWRKGGKIIKRIWADGHYDFGCHFCGRAAGNGERG